MEQKGLCSIVKHRQDQMLLVHLQWFPLLNMVLTVTRLQLRNTPVPSAHVISVCDSYSETFNVEDIKPLPCLQTTVSGGKAPSHCSTTGRGQQNKKNAVSAKRYFRAGRAIDANRATHTFTMGVTSG